LLDLAEEHLLGVGELAGVGREGLAVAQHDALELELDDVEPDGADPADAGDCSVCDSGRFASLADVAVVRPGHSNCHTPKSPMLTTRRKARCHPTLVTFVASCASSRRGERRGSSLP